MNKLLVKQISLFSGGGLVFLAGLFYVLMTDLKMNNSATWLFIGIILAFGGSILFMLCESTKEKPKLLYPLKGLSVLISLGYVVFLFLFKNTSVYKDITLDVEIKKANIIILIAVIIALLGVIAQGLNIVFHVLTRNED